MCIIQNNCILIKYLQLAALAVVLAFAWVCRISLFKIIFFLSLCARLFNICLWYVGAKFRHGSRVSSIPSTVTALVQSVAKEKCGKCTYKKVRKTGEEIKRRYEQDSFLGFDSKNSKLTLTLVLSDGNFELTVFLKSYMPAHCI